MHMLTTCKNTWKTESRRDTTWSFKYNNLCLIEWISYWSHKMLTTCFYHECFINEDLNVWVTQNYSKILILISEKREHKVVFIDKTIITVCNRLKCSFQHLESFQEQCNRLDSWFNRLKSSESLQGTLSIDYYHLVID